MKSYSYFLGANTPCGFYSLFNELYNPDEDYTMYIIKGGPGTGKSSIMKKISAKSESEGYITERIYCSSDPTSLDAVIIPELKVSVADGTSPHTINPVFPGVCEATVDLSCFWNKNKLKDNSDIIKRLTRENSAAHKKSVSYLKAASIIDKEITDTITKITDFNKLERFCLRLCKTEIKSYIKGNRRKRFLSAVSPDGITVQYNNILNSEDKIICLNDKYSVIASYITEYIDKYSDTFNSDKTVCYCPLNPEIKKEHLLLTDNFNIFTCNTYHPKLSDCYKTINCDRFLNKESLNSIKNKLAFLQKSKLELIGEAVNNIKQAKDIHDILESYYIAAMDFSAVSHITDNLIDEIFR